MELSYHEYSRIKNPDDLRSIWKKSYCSLSRFSGNLFQQLYNTADSLIVGNFLDSNALAAVSSSGNLIFLMVGFFNGIAMGAGVVIARYYGARNKKDLNANAPHSGSPVHCGKYHHHCAGLILTPFMLRLMHTPENVMAGSASYLRIYFGGIVFVFIYNVGVCDPERRVGIPNVPCTI